MKEVTTGQIDTKTRDLLEGGFSRVESQITNLSKEDLLVLVKALSGVESVKSFLGEPMTEINDTHHKVLDSIFSMQEDLLAYSLTNEGVENV